MKWLQMEKSRNSLVYLVYKLVKTLDKARSLEFKAEVSSRRKGEVKYIKLYEFLNRMREFDEDQILKLFKNDKASLNVALLQLRINLLKFLAMQETRHALGLDVAKKAFENGFIKYGFRLLEKELVEAVDSENLLYIQKIQEEEALQSEKHGIPIIERRGLGDPLTMAKELAMYASSKYYSKRIKTVFFKSQVEKDEMYAEMAEMVHSLWDDPISVTTRYSILKANFNLNFLGRRRQENLKIQATIVDIMFHNLEHFSTRNLMEELNLYIISLTLEQDFEEAEKQLQIFSGMDVPLDLEVHHLGLIIRNSLTISASKGDVVLGMKAVKDFERNKDIFQPHRKGLFSHIASLILFYKEDWEAVLEHQNTFRLYLRTKFNQFSWSPVVCKAICLFEMGQYGNCRKFIGRYREKECSHLDYPNMILGLILSLMDNEENQINKNHLLMEAKAKLERVRLDRENIPHLNFFDVGLWLDSKVKGKAIIDLLNDENIPKLMGFRSAV